ncbi:PP2C family protein-serine/threonine phosphatase [Marinospirillum alkaliphilum]|uniref:Serine phosphatase RsbU, regulator of sigma subunit n=1 Tax=Marinospirillum alkaliphilum DSM 21637 TaxID=1122209 RepID=A0A1K1UC37_9GAMM|nr:PP2C family protein-serine/threonine phosphatase [Marinospirillum alkaliphilum]SFX10593.1 Serine phosphatase RsbU, regulator of sigma subunit [Marinospirillum alkaliphilum DSM 21637]
MIRLLTRKIRSLHWFILLAVFLSSLIVFIGVSGISSLLYENLMADQARYLAEQLSDQPPGTLAELELPSITTEVRITYILTFIFFSAFFLLAAIVFSHFAIRRINQSIGQFNEQVRLIQSSRDLKRFDAAGLNFVFTELNQAFTSVNSLARQLEAVLVDKSALEIKADLLSKLIIKNSGVHDWNEYVQEVFQDIQQTLPFDLVAVVFETDGHPEMNIFWQGQPDHQTEQQAISLVEGRLVSTPRLCHYLLNDSNEHSFDLQPGLTAQLRLDQPRVGGITGLLIHSPVLQDPTLQLSMQSILTVLLNLLGASRAISGYTHQLEQAISQAEQENAMAADVLYGHLLVNNADRLPGIYQQIRSSGNFSGDIVLVKRSPSGSTFILLADATGHGLSATITIMPVISVFEAMVQKGHQLPFILSEMNKRLLKDLPDDRFVAALLIEVDPIHSEVSIWNGGMPPALQLDDQGQLQKSFNSRHMALGILDETLFDGTPERLPLPDSGHLLMYSDGLPEQPDRNGQLFSRERMLELLGQIEPANFIPELITAVEQHSGKAHPADDVSLCQIDFAQLQRHPVQETTLEHLKRNLLYPFQWQVQIYGEQLTRQALPALCHDFMQTLGLNMQLRRRVFAIIHELTQKLLDTNLLELPDQQELLEEEAGLTRYYQLKRDALQRLSAADYLKLSLVADLQQAGAPALVIEVADSGKQTSPLASPTALPTLCALADKVECLEAGHRIRVQLG